MRNPSCRRLPTSPRVRRPCEPPRLPIGRLIHLIGPRRRWSLWWLPPVAVDSHTVGPGRGNCRHARRMTRGGGADHRPREAGRVVGAFVPTNASLVASYALRASPPSSSAAASQRRRRQVARVPDPRHRSGRRRTPQNPAQPASGTDLCSGWSATRGRAPAMTVLPPVQHDGPGRHHLHRHARESRIAAVGTDNQVRAAAVLLLSSQTA